jgi:hypothetical protein
MQHALFSYRKETMPSSSFIGSDGHPTLFEKISDRGIKPVVSLNAESAFEGDQIAVHERVSGETLSALGHISIESVGIVVNRLNRSFKNDVMPDRWRNDSPVIVNENQMRSLAFRKHRVQAEVFEPLGLGMPTKLLESDDDATEFMAAHQAEQYILKPNSGTFSQDVRRLSKEVIADQSKIGLPEKSTIIQPAYDFTAPFDPSIRPFDIKSADEFYGWSQSDAVKEFRMYAFHSANRTSLFPVARAMQGGEDKWIFVDPASIPDKLYHSTEQVIQRSASITGSRAIYAALDFGYGKLHPDDENDYHAIELNGKMPYLIAHEKHADVANVLRDQYADMVQAAVEGSGHVL